MDVIFDVVRNIVKTKYEDLPEDVIRISKQFIIDSIGVGIAGSSTLGNAEIMSLIEEWGGKEESTILVYGLKVPAPNAAFGNSILIHSDDYDDTDDRTATHANVTALPSALAIAEKIHSSGKTLITAVSLGVDLTCRLALACNLFHGWHNTATVGIFGAAVAAGKVLGLDQTQMVNAMGMAYSQAAGNRQARKDGTQTKRLQPAFSAKAGVISALLAQKGITGAQNVMQGQWGFFRLYRDYSKEYEPNKWAEALKDELGIRFEGVNLGFKPYPCVRAAHAPIDAALQLAIQHNIKPEDLIDVTIFTNQRVIDTAGGPFVIRTNPEIDAKFSIPYTIAVALTKKEVTLNDFHEKAIKNPTLVKLAEKVRLVIDPEFKDSTSTVGPIKLKIRMKNGQDFSRRVEFAKGHPQNPMNEHEISDKFRDCVRKSIKSIPEQQVGHLLNILNKLEDVDDISELIKMLT